MPTSVRHRPLPPAPIQVLHSGGGPRHPDRRARRLDSDRACQLIGGHHQLRKGGHDASMAPPGPNGLLLPIAGYQEFVEPITPFRHQVHVKPRPRNRARVIRDDDLQFPLGSRDGRYKGLEDSLYARYVVDIGLLPPTWHRRSTVCLPGAGIARPSIGEVDLTRLIDHQVAGHRRPTLLHKILLKREHRRKMVADPVLAASHFPQEILPRPAADPHGEVGYAKASTLLPTFEFQQARVVADGR